VVWWGNVWVNSLIIGIVFMSSNTCTPERRKQAKTILITSCSVMAFWMVVYIIAMVAVSANI